MTGPIELNKRVLSWAINGTNAPLTEVRIDYAYTDADFSFYAVRTGTGLCLNTHGEWVEDEAARWRHDAWLTDHRFELWQAEVLAYAAARELAITLMTAGAEAVINKTRKAVPA